MTPELGQATTRKPPFKYSAFTRVGFSDTDAQGVVYYGRYLPFFDQARVEYHRHLGQLNAGVVVEELAMRATTIDYLAPAQFDDLLEVFVRLSAIGRTSATYELAAYRVHDDLLLVTARQTVVLIDRATRQGRPIGDSFRWRIGDFEGDDLEVASPA